MNKLVLAMTMATMATMASGALADEAAQSPHQFTGTATVTSDYLFRGVTQTWHKPAIQGSIDYAHTSGVFASLWGSTISDKVIAGSRIEINLAMGFRKALDENWSFGAGVITVYYPGGNWNKMRWGDRPDQRYDFTDVNASLGYKWLGVKYSRTLTDLLGFNEKTGFSGSTKGADYIELNADIPLSDTGLVLGLHAGHQDFKASVGDIESTAKDYRVSLSKTFDGGWLGGVHWSRNANAAFFNGTRSNLDERDTRDVGKARVAVSLTKLF